MHILRRYISTFLVCFSAFVFSEAYASDEGVATDWVTGSWGVSPSEIPEGFDKEAI